MTNDHTIRGIDKNLYLSAGGYARAITALKEFNVAALSWLTRKTTPTESALMMRQAGRFIHNRGGRRNFRIHRAFRQSLGLSPRHRVRAS